MRILTGGMGVSVCVFVTAVIRQDILLLFPKR